MGPNLRPPAPGLRPPEGEGLAFGGYELLEKVATGGMAEIFRARARRPGGVSKIVCLKRIHPTLCADPAFVDMFVEEARLGLSLSHGNIVPVFDFGCVDGYHFLVMEFVEGHDLAEIIGRSRIVERPFPTDLATHIVAQVLEGLAYAHGRTDEAQRPLNLVHRDVSPSNVMVSTAGEVKVLDFGIARSALREFRTRTGVVKGKPGYMAPEQARGDAIDARADVFSCGVMLHELLAGARPDLPGASDEGCERALAEIEDAELRSIIEQSLEPDPADRFASAAEMRDALHEVMAARSMWPRPDALARHVASLFETPAALPDWSLGARHELQAGERDDASGTFDRHLAALVDDAGPGSPAITPALESSVQSSPMPPSGPVTEPMGEPEPGLHGHDRERGQRPGRRGLVALVVVAIVAVAAALWPGLAPRQARTTARGDGGQHQAAPAIARVEIRTTPPGATIVVDGEARGEATPLVLEVAEGAHRLELSLAGFVPQTRTVDAQAGQQVLIDTVLVPAPGSLRITSAPAAADVWINGRPEGVTPVDVVGLDRAATYRVEVKLSRHEPWQRDVAFAGEERVEVHAELVREARPSKIGQGSDATGFLSVVAHPWAEVLLDGQTLGVTPIIRRQTRAGRHELLLRNAPRGLEVRRPVTVPDGDEVRVSVDLTRSEP